MNVDRDAHPLRRKEQKELNRLVLEDLYARKRVLRAETSGWILPIEFHYDSDGIAGSGIADEYYAARDEAAVIDLSRWEFLTLDQPGQIAALERILTVGAAGLKPGSSRRSAWLDAKGHLRALLRLLAVKEGILVECPREAAGALARQLKLNRETGADGIGPLVAFGLLGPKRWDIVAKSGADRNRLKEGEHCAVDLAGPPMQVLRPDGSPAGLERSIPVRVLNTSDLPSGLLLCVVRERAEDLWMALKAAGVEAMAYDAFNFHRIEQGLPWYGLDIGPECTLQEAGMEICLRHEKRSIAERPAKRLMRVMLDNVASEGDPIMAEGQEAGWMTTFVTGVTTGPCLGMGFVREPWCRHGAKVSVNGGRAVVVDMKGILDRSTYER